MIGYSIILKDFEMTLCSLSTECKPGWSVPCTMPSGYAPSSLRVILTSCLLTPSCQNPWNRMFPRPAMQSRIHSERSAAVLDALRARSDSHVRQRAA